LFGYFGFGSLYNRTEPIIKLLIQALITNSTTSINYKIYRRGTPHLWYISYIFITNNIRDKKESIGTSHIWDRQESRWTTPSILVSNFAIFEMYSPSHWHIARGNNTSWSLKPPNFSQFTKRSTKGGVDSKIEINSLALFSLLCTLLVRLNTNVGINCAIKQNTRWNTRSRWFGRYISELSIFSGTSVVMYIWRRISDISQVSRQQYYSVVTNNIKLQGWIRPSI